MIETQILTFTITTPFPEWVKIYDGSADLQKSAGIVSLYRGVTKDDPTQVCAVLQGAPGVMDKFMADNTEMIKASGHVLESTVIHTFVDH